MTGPILIDDVKRLVIKPGETLLLRFKHDLTAAEVARIGAELSSMLPRGVKLIVQDKNAPEFTVISADQKRGDQ